MGPPISLLSQEREKKMPMFKFHLNPIKSVSSRSDVLAPLLFDARKGVTLPYHQD